MIWMKISELARYGAARELTRIERIGDRIKLTAPFACPRFTLRLATTVSAPPRLVHRDASIALAHTANLRRLKPGGWLREAKSAVVCFDLPKGETMLDA